MMQNKRWSDLSPAQRGFILALGSLELSLAATALVDIARRPAEAINGSKWAWALASLVSFVGPMAYFTWGRREPQEQMPTG